jgi:hypothetical protein
MAYGVAAVVLAGVGALYAQEGAASGASTAAAGDVLYEDAGALSSATVTQILPNANKEIMTVDHLRRVRVKSDILILEWGTTAVTLLPRQYVGSMTINRRNDPGAGARTGAGGGTGARAGGARGDAAEASGTQPSRGVR